MKKLLLILALALSANAWANDADCRDAENKLDSAQRELSKANNYYNINSISCNNVGPSCLRPQPRQCKD